MYLLVIKQLVIMLLIACSSFIVTKIYHFGKVEQQFVSKNLLMYINPCLILSHFNLDFDSVRLKNFGIVTLISVAVHIVMIAIALVFSHSKKGSSIEEKDLDSIDKIAVVMTNCGFVGIPLISGVLGDEGVFYLLSFIATFNVCLWTYGYFVITRKFNFRKIITNPNIICVIIGILIFCLPFKLPEIISKPLNLIGSMNTATAMILLGMLFATFQKKNSEINYKRRLLKVFILRHFVVAVAVFLVVLTVYKLFPQIPDIRMMCYVVFIAALCPTGMSVSSLAVVFDKDESYAALICMGTSVVCVVTLPLSVALAELII